MTSEAEPAQQPPSPRKAREKVRAVQEYAVDAKVRVEAARHHHRSVDVAQRTSTSAESGTA